MEVWMGLENRTNFVLMGVILKILIISLSEKELDKEHMPSSESAFTKF
jgi:hypothetical protein